MFIILGILLLAVGAIIMFINNKASQAEKLNEQIDKFNEGRESYHQKEKYAVFRLPPKFKPLYFFAVGGVLILLQGMFFWANAGTAYSVQYPWGGDKMVTTQGIKFKGYGRVIPLSYEISIKDIIQKPDEEGNYEQLSKSEDGIYNRRAQRWEFSDAIKADISIAVVVGVDTKDEEVFLNMADRNRSEAKLIYGRVMPNIDAALKNTCKLMDAQEYISGKASDFDRYFRDQLENGMYLVEEYVEEVKEPEIIGDTTTVRTIAPVSNNKQIKYRIKRDDNGNIIRDNKSNTLKQYGIKIYQAQVTGIDWEESFDERLQLQKEQVAQTQLEKQEAEKEFYRAKKEVAKGESEKAAERARLEKEQIKLTIAAETRAKVAEQDFIAEKKRYEVEKLKAASKKVAADAQAYENQRLVNAGLTPQERIEAEIKMNEDRWKYISDMKLPNYYMSGASSGSKQASMLESILSMELLKSKTK